MGGDPVPGVHLLIPFLAWGRGEPCPICKERPHPDIEAKWTKWLKWSKEHMFNHVHERG